MTKVKELIASELAQLNSGFVATPKSLDVLMSFARANHGSNDMLLMQMSIQLGIKLGLESIAESVALLEMTAE